jgi:putative tricarboxylic transport membrane protein
LAKVVGIPVQSAKTVSFDSGSEGITAVLGGHVDVVVTPPGSMMQFVTSKEMRVLAVAGDNRVGGALSEVPTWKEVGYDVAVSAWRGIVGPPGMTPEQIAFWQKAFAEFMESEQYKKSAEEEILTARYLNAAESARFLGQMDQQFRDYLKVVGVEPK